MAVVTIIQTASGMLGGLGLVGVAVHPLVVQCDLCVSVCSRLGGLSERNLSVYTSEESLTVKNQAVFTWI